MATRKPTTPPLTFTPTLSDLLGTARALRKIEVPELSGDQGTAYLYMRPLSAGVMMDFTDAADPAAQKAGMIRLLIYALCDETGTPIFPNDETGVNAARALPMTLFNRLSQLVLEHMKDSADAAKNE